MSKITNAFTLSLSTAFAMAALASPAAHAESVFKSQTLTQGYQLAENDAKPMEGKCGADKKSADGKCGADMSKKKDGKCGEGKCGAGMKKSTKEGKCGTSKKAEGKCGGDKK